MKSFRSLHPYSVDVYLCLFLFCGLTLSFAGHGSFVDENLIIQTVESLTTRGELTVTQMFQALPGSDGKYYSRYGVSFPLLLTPFYLLGHGLNWIFPHTYAFFMNPHFFMMLWGNLLITVFTGWMFYRLCLLNGGSVSTSALLSTALIFATPFWPYSQTLFRLTASCAALLIVLFFVTKAIRAPSRLSLAVIGGTTALGLNLREDLVLGFMAMGVYVLCCAKGRARWTTALSLILGAIAGFLIWGWHNWIRFDSFFIENYEDLSFDYPIVLSLPQLLVGLRRGLSTYAPLSLLLPLSFGAAKRRGRLNMWLLCASIISAYLLLYGKSSMWHGGVCWGPRHMYFLLPFCFLPGIWLLGDLSSRMKRWFVGIAFFLGMLMNFPGVYSHQGKYQDFFASPSFFSLLMKPVIHLEYITFDELDLWWIRMIKMNPVSLWPIALAVMIGLTVWALHRLIQAVRLAEQSDEMISKVERL
ncbi:MAG: hypothetical protein JXR73_10510 [Candidatus Omnitrophica bacterium]|nr:hypothetical protein [Candidatus Omnitrophota bacterium]